MKSKTRISAADGPRARVRQALVIGTVPPRRVLNSKRRSDAYNEEGCAAESERCAVGEWCGLVPTLRPPHGNALCVTMIRMTEDRVKAVLNRVSTWPQERQRELAEIALEMEAGMTGGEYHATPEELEAIDEGLQGEAASGAEVDAAFAAFRGA